MTFVASEAGQMSFISNATARRQEPNLAVLQQQQQQATKLAKLRSAGNPEAMYLAAVSDAQTIIPTKVEQHLLQ